MCQTDQCTSLAQRTHAGRRRRGRRRCRSSGKERRASTGRGALGIAAGTVSGKFCDTESPLSVASATQRTLCSLLVWAVTALKGVVCSSGASIVEECAQIWAERVCRCEGLYGRLDGSMRESATVDGEMAKGRRVAGNQKRQGPLRVGRSGLARKTQATRLGGKFLGGCGSATFPAASMSPGSLQRAGPVCGASCLLWPPGFRVLGRERR